MNFLSRIRSGFRRAGAAIKQAVQSLIKPPAFPTSALSGEDLIKQPEPKSMIRNRIMREKEREAYERALWMIKNGMENPDSAMAQKGKDDAILYLNKSKELSGKGSLQDWSRQQAAEKLLRNKYSTPEGQAQMFQDRLDQMNRNLNIKLTPDTYKTLKNITDTDSFQKLMELGKSYYKEVYGSVADEVDSGTDPKRIEQTLDLFTRVGMDDFEAFSDIVNLDPENYGLFYERAQESIYDVNPDQVDLGKVFSNLLEEFDL